jgi:hypothetical protein
MNNFNNTTFAKKYEHGGRSKVKIHIYFYRDNSRTVALGQIQVGTVKITDIPTSIIFKIILFDEALKYGDGAKCCGYVGTNAEPPSSAAFTALAGP